MSAVMDAMIGELERQGVAYGGLDVPALARVAVDAMLIEGRLSTIPSAGELREALIAAQPYLNAFLKSVESVDIEVLGEPGRNVALRAVIEQVAAALTAKNSIGGLVEANSVREILRRACNGNQRAWAIQHSISPQHVTNVLQGRREPHGVLLNALGLERVVSYRPSRSW